MRRTLAAILLVSVTSCSFVFTRSPGKSGNPPDAAPNCTEDRHAVNADIAMSIVFILVSLASIGVLADPRATDDRDERRAFIPIGIASAVIGTVATAGAYYGIKWTRECRQANSQYAIANPHPIPQGPPSPPGEENGPCTDAMTCNPGFVCALGPDHQNRCLVPPKAPPVPVGVVEGGPCTPQLTCFHGLVCAGQPDGTNRCMGAP